MALKVYPLGVVVERDHNSAPGFRSCSPRGKVESFSCASRRRLRKFLLTCYIPDCLCYGVGLSLPRSEFSYDLVCANFRIAFHRFRTYFLRRFPRSGFVWRVELQRSRMPHFHLVVYAPYLSADHVFRLWFDSVNGLFSIPSYSDFSRHGFDVKLLDGNIRAFRYLCDHGSKRKQAQLGWQGRQWGIVGRRNFTSMLCSEYDLPDYLLSRFRRFLSRVCSRRVPADCVFGCKLLRRRSSFSVVYCSSDTALRWLRFHGISPLKKQ